MKRAIFCQWMTSPNATGKPFHKCYCPAEFQVTDKGVKVGKVCINHAVEAHNEHGRTRFTFEPASMAVLVRRLMESGDDHAESLASAICDTLDIELV